MSKDDKKSYNNLLFPHDDGPITVNRTGTAYAGSEMDTTNRFRDESAYMPVTPKDTWKNTERAFRQKQAAAAATSTGATSKQATTAPAAKKMTSANYQKAYLQKQRTTAGTPTHQRTLSAEAEKAQLKRKETENILAQKDEALKLQNEMRWWELQRGNGTHDDRTIDAQIDMLQRSLQNIPPQFWS